MNRLSHLLFAFSMFVGLYSLLFGFSVWQSDLGRLMEMLPYYLLGGFILTMVAVPILYWKAPHKSTTRTTSNRSAVGAMAFVTFSVGSLVGSGVYQWISGVAVVGSISVFIGSLITITGALMPDWDIPLLGISRHRNIVFHSAILPILITLGTLLNVAYSVLMASSLSVGAHVEYYITALFLLGYASHLYLDIFPSDASPLEVFWRAADPYSKAPTGLKQLGPIKISRKNARNWLVGNATLLVMIAIGLFSLYFYNLSILAP